MIKKTISILASLLCLVPVAVLAQVTDPQKQYTAFEMRRNGKIYVDGTPEEIFSSTDPVVHRFVNGIADLKEHDF